VLEFASCSEGGKSMFFCVDVLVPVHSEPTSGLEPLTCSSYECAVSGCWALQRFANTAYVSGSLFPRLLGIAEHCVRVRVKLGSSGVWARELGTSEKRSLLSASAPH
jgi:hypothetical protein